jgi:hypothetical protein
LINIPARRKPDSSQRRRRVKIKDRESNNRQRAEVWPWRIIKGVKEEFRARRRGIRGREGERRRNEK